MERMPVVFVGHGSPMNVIENNSFTAGWKDMARVIPVPRAILCISAHWYGPGQRVSRAAEPETIHDFYGFPRELYAINYPAPGAPALAEKAAELMGTQAEVTAGRGLDHGAWGVLRLMYPEARVPVCQLSVDSSAFPGENYQTGQKLAPLRDEGVLILGSGNIVHNLNLVEWDNEAGFPWADNFDNHIREAILADDHDRVIHYKKAGESSEQAFYYRDHFDPLLYVLGAAGQDRTKPTEVYNNRRVMGSMSMTSYILR